MERVLITGAAGFLGSHLCDRFLKEGFKVEGMDNLITGDMKNIAHLAEHPNFTFHRHDVTEYIDIEGDLDPANLSNFVAEVIFAIVSPRPCDLVSFIIIF